MFGADTPLVMDALQIAAVVAVLAGAGVYLLMRRNGLSSAASHDPQSDTTNLEDRVRVLERIATDRSIDLADEIEALREPAGGSTNDLNGEKP